MRRSGDFLGEMVLYPLQRNSVETEDLPFPARNLRKMAKGDRRSGKASADGHFDEPIGETTFEITHQELRNTFEYQFQRLQEIDGKAIEILKANLLLIGIVVTGGSILIQTDLELGPFLNVFTATGGALLLISTGVAAVTYTASNLRGGINADAVEAAIAVGSTGNIHSESAEAFEERLLRSYAQWIDYNTRVTAVNDMLATITVLLVFVAFVYVVAGVVSATLPLTTFGMAVGFSVTTLLVGAFTWVAYHMDHLGFESEQQQATFEGVRLSKGTTRKEGLSVFRAMVARRPDSDHEELPKMNE